MLINPLDEFHDSLFCFNLKQQNVQEGQSIFVIVNYDYSGVWLTKEENQYKVISLIPKDDLIVVDLD